MERRTFLKGTGAISAGSFLGAFNPWVSPATATNRIVGIPPASSQPLATESDDLSPYTGPWGDTQLRHLLRRAMFGVPPAQFQAAQAFGSMNAVVSKLLAASDLTKVPLPPKPASYVDDFLAPVPGDTTGNNNKQRLDAMRVQQVVNWWFDLIVQENLSIREKMTLMWTNHSVTGSQTVKYAGYVYQYLSTCRQYSLGNLKDFVSAISIDPAMLLYLNGNQNYVRNNKSFVNENYARELMELFTLGLLDPHVGTSNYGQPNYTETDVQNSARALTGWSPTTTAPFVGQFNAAMHDSTSKTFLGQTGNFALQDILNIIFEQGTPAGYSSAYFLSQTIYTTFVYYNPNPSVIDAMAQMMLANNFEIAPVMQALLTSAHFYDANVIGAQLKSPAEYAGSLVREFSLTYPAFNSTDPPIKNTDGNGLNTYTDTNPTLSLITSAIMGTSQGQPLLNPPNVKGWPGGHNWISTGTFQGRENYSTYILSNLYVNSKQNLALAFNADVYAEQIANDTTLTPEVLSKALEDTSLAFTLGPLESGDLNTDIQGTYKEPNYQYNTVGAKNFALYLTSLPEFQLL
jgi:uncharacterized protein (DUF1800 family)